MGQDFSAIKSFALLRHLHHDWPKWLSFMRKNDGKAEIEKMAGFQEYLPSKDDFSEARHSIYLLVSMYDLKVQDFSRGRINGRQYRSRLDVLDSFALAKFGHQKGYYLQAEDWFKMTEIFYFFAFSKPLEVMGFNFAQAWQLYARNLLDMNKKVSALKVLREALTWASHDVVIERQINELKGDLYQLGQPKKDQYEEFYPAHKDGCRGLFEDSNDLSCHYDFTTHPFLRLAPFKVEVLNEDPFVAKYYDVIYDNEISELKNITIPVMTRSSTVNRESYEMKKNPGRTSKGHFHPSNSSWVVKSINQRISQITGFGLRTKKSGDSILVLNYGLGGQYLPHYDTLGANSTIYISEGDRLATVIFYLSDVEQGGLTVFPHLQISHTPQKGTALLFYNLNPKTLQKDKYSAHSACPVLMGSKWVSATWIYSADQMFHLPCALQYDNDDDSFEDLEDY
nr:prolyl 4-hydroxylase subunit alpha-2-like isoform X2 [Drosophila suzukii]